LYAVGTASDASLATPLISAIVKTNTDGSFDITSLYSCADATEVYITATGGNPTPLLTNPNLAMMTALGPCSSLSKNTAIEINELTTVAAVYSLAPFMSSLKNIGSGPSDAPSLGSAFSLAAELVNTSTGLAPGIGVPYGESVPTLQIDTIGDIVASCVNSPGGTAGDSSLCGQFFSLTTPSGGSVPQDTIQALLNLANNPTLNTDSLYQLVGASPPFTSNDTSVPPDLRVRLQPSSPSGYVLQVGPSALAFPSTETSTTASVQTVVISNSGAAAISLGSFSVTGPNAADFAQNSSCGATLGPNTSCSTSIMFTPQQAGMRSAFLSVPSSSPNSPQYVQLSGVGAAVGSAAPHAVVSPTQIFTSPGTSQDLTLSNTGTAPLIIGSVSVATTNNTLTSNCGSSLQPGASCIASVHTNIPSYDQLTFATNDPDLAPIAIEDAVDPLSPNFVSPADLFFQNTILGNASSQSATFQYSGAPYPLITGPNAADFTFGPSCSDQNVVLYSNCTVTVTFTPSGSGLRTASVVFTPYGSYLPLGGYGISSSPGPNVTLSETTADFSDSLSPQVITVSNYGSSAVGIQSIAIQSLLGASEYAETNDCGTSLAAQSVCHITLTSDRRIQGGTEALLSVSGDFGTFGVPLHNHLDLFYDFGSSFTGDAVLSTLDQIYGPGSTSGTLTGSNPGDFSLSSCSAVHGFECFPNISFVPTALGLRTAVATMDNVEDVDNVPTPSTQTYFLVGTGVSSSTPGVIVSPINLSNAAIGTTASGSAPLTIRNSGTDPITPSFSISGPAASEFGLPTGCDASLAIGSSCTGIISYQSSQEGFSTATLNVTDTTSGQTFSQPIYMFTQVGPPVSPTSLTFPDTLQNDVSAPLSITVTPAYRHAVSATSTSQFTATKANCAADEVPCILTFVFAPTAVGSFSQYATISDTYEGTATAVQLSGNATAPVIPGVAGVSPTSLSFPLRSVNTTSLPMPVTLSNTGAGSFAITSLGFSGTNAAEFSLATTCGSTVAPNTNCAINVTFAPTVAGPKSASLVISGDSNAGLPISVPITGSAQ
jgi:hypothetical protein